jgi:hypothetical protein
MCLVQLLTTSNFGVICKSDMPFRISGLSGKIDIGIESCNYFYMSKHQLRLCNFLKINLYVLHVIRKKIKHYLWGTNIVIFYVVLR